METRLLFLAFALRCLLIAAGVANETELLRERRPALAVTRRVRLHGRRVVEIITCLHNAPHVGCDIFACLENTTGVLDDSLYEIYRNFAQNADNFDVQGKQFIKDFLKCNAIGIKSRFCSSVSSCAEVQRTLVQVQVKCYQQHVLQQTATSKL